MSCMPSYKPSFKKPLQIKDMLKELLIYMSLSFMTTRFASRGSVVTYSVVGSTKEFICGHLVFYGLSCLTSTNASLYNYTFIQSCMFSEKKAL